MKQKINNFFSKLVFGLFFVYIIILGIINVSIASNKETIETFLAKKMFAQSVELENISNLPLVFISGTKVSATINQNLSLSIEGIYFYYRFWTLFTGDFEKFLGNIRIEKIVFDSHMIDIKDYIKVMKNAYAVNDTEETVPKPDSFALSLENFDVNVIVRQIDIEVRAMQEFKNNIIVDNIILDFENDHLSTQGRMRISSVWSNMVFLFSGDMAVHAELTNINNLSGEFLLDFNDLNLGGIPLVQEMFTMRVAVSNQKTDVSFIDNSEQGIEVDIRDSDFNVNIDREFRLAYNDFEEYKLLDYVFKAGLWRFKADYNHNSASIANISFLSPQHPGYGLQLRFRPYEFNTYNLNIKLDTHFFGSVYADLIFNDFVKDLEKGLYPLPSGIAKLDNVRFILAGLVFSGGVVIDRVPNQNAMDLNVFDVHMNGGRIGHVAARMSFPKGKSFVVQPIPIANPAGEVFVDMANGNVDVDIKALDVDGDFVVKNVRLPFFGIGTSRYTGDIKITKFGRDAPVRVSGDVVGYLDGEKQIDAQLKVTDNHIEIPYFKFLTQNISLNGEVFIDSCISNTMITIDGAMERADMGELPIDVDVLVHKKDAIVTGSIDEKVIFRADSDSVVTDFVMEFENYSMKKLGIDGVLAGKLDMGFDPEGWTRFTFVDGSLTTQNRKFHVGFESEKISNVLSASNVIIGLDNEKLRGTGYFSVSDDGNVGGAFNFQRGGFLSFLTGSYTWKFNTDIRGFVIENIATLPLVDQLISEENENIGAASIDLKLALEGLWADPDFKASLNVDSAGYSEYFRLVLPQIEKQGTQWAVSNIRFRSLGVNADADVFVQDYDNILVSGAFSVLGNSVKSDFELSYQNTNNLLFLKYKLPDLYVISRRPMDLSGQIRYRNNTALFVPDNPKQGIAGSWLQSENGSRWDLKFQTDSVVLNSSGLINNNDIRANVNTEFFLDKMAFAEMIRSSRGTVNLHSLITGELDTPIVNGKINLQGVSLRHNALRTPIAIPENTEITVTNNQFVFPEVLITAGNDNQFVLDGTTTIGDNGIQSADLRFTGNSYRRRPSAFNWNLRVPYFSLQGKTFIDYINLIGEGNDLILSAHILAENMKMNLELGDAFNSSSEMEPTINPALTFLSVLNLDIKLDILQNLRFVNELFDISMETPNPILVQGNIGDNTVVIDGSMDITKGTVKYLNTDLKVENGTIQFSQESGDPYPNLNMETFVSRYNNQNDLTDIYVSFQGKLPSIELSSISSSPSRDRRELLAMLSGGFSEGSSRSGQTSFQSQNASGEVLATGVEVVENIFFTSPLTQRIQKLIPFDTFEIKTEVLGNVTRLLSGGNSAFGFNVLHGSELSIGQFIPNVPNLQVKYDLRLESPDNSGLNISGELTQIHQAGLEFILPVRKHRVGLGASISGRTGAETRQDIPEFVGNITYRTRW